EWETVDLAVGIVQFVRVQGEISSLVPGCKYFSKSQFLTVFKIGYSLIKNKGSTYSGVKIGSVVFTEYRYPVISPHQCKKEVIVIPPGKFPICRQGAEFLYGRSRIGG